MLRETLTPQGAVDRLTEAVVHRRARPGEVELDPVPGGPGIERPRGELSAVVDRDPRRQGAAGAEALQHGRDVLTAEPGAGHGAEEPVALLGRLLENVMISDRTHHCTHHPAIPRAFTVLPSVGVL